MILCALFLAPVCLTAQNPKHDLARAARDRVRAFMKEKGLSHQIRTDGHSIGTSLSACISKPDQPCKRITQIAPAAERITRQTSGDLRRLWAPVCRSVEDYLKSAGERTRMDMCPQDK